MGKDIQNQDFFINYSGQIQATNYILLNFHLHVHDLQSTILLQTLRDICTPTLLNLLYDNVKYDYTTNLAILTSVYQCIAATNNIDSKISTISRSFG